ncbi:cell division inhibitor [Flagellimonas alvinocaridis]|uniref:Cell division inhibitor n=1 Tax=Flagellimonas alvinocaridis TaxID=2530200 RepID=A0A4S8RH74_9FLAO|nr:SRPBCC family protein [Allomuricauda alvinocaridis]THV57260.1 cell division inhibitor [Allomuricauda alvinocaridis]
MYQLKATQILPISKKEAWEFLSNPKNLKTITPRHMGFHILDGADGKMFPGQIIQYKVKPFPFANFRWVTEITHVVDNDYFVDEQRFGPYVLWHHKHFLKETLNGTVMEDIVDYKLPFGFFGRLAHFIWIEKQLKHIFRYREEKLTQLFGNVKDTKNSISTKRI